MRLGFAPILLFFTRCFWFAARGVWLNSRGRFEIGDGKFIRRSSNGPIGVSVIAPSFSSHCCGTSLCCLSRRQISEDGVGCLRRRNIVSACMQLLHQRSHFFLSNFGLLIDLGNKCAHHTLICRILRCLAGGNLDSLLRRRTGLNTLRFAIFPASDVSAVFPWFSTLINFVSITSISISISTPVR